MAESAKMAFHEASRIFAQAHSQIAAILEEEEQLTDEEKRRYQAAVHFAEGMAMLATGLARASDR